MVFSSALFLTFFLPLVLGTYFLARDSLRNYVLLFASLLFYSWGEPIATLIMIVLIFISYFLAICIENNILNLRKTFLALGVTINLAVLFFL